MARSTYVYLVLRNGYPHRAFTVKHELSSHLDGRKDLKELVVYRMADGGYPHKPTTLLDTLTLNAIEEV